MNNVKKSNSAHQRLYIFNFNKNKSAKDINEIAKYYTKENYHRSTIEWQNKLNRKLNKKEKKQLFRAYENRVYSNFSLPTKKYKNQPNYIDFK